VKLKITVHGVAYEVDVEVLDPGDGFPVSGPLPAPGVVPAEGGNPGPAAPAAGPTTVMPAAPPAAAPSTEQAGGLVTSPIAGTVIEVKCSAGQEVDQGQVLLVIEAMKMNTSIAAPVAGTVKKCTVAAGDNVREGDTLVQFE